MPTSWRIVKAALAATAMDGEGARINGGRWNSPGTAVVYTSQTRSLAVLEILAHLQSSEILLSYVTIPVSFDDAVVEIVDPAQLPANWSENPAPSTLKEIGDRWAAAKRSAVLQVPSAIIPDEYNFVLDPRHPDFASVAIGEPTGFRLDPRLK
jgi:RES domain-containing protein